MTTSRMSGRLSACRITASVFGVLAGIGGLTHGVGEVLQGNVEIDGIALDSWTTGPIARYMGGEPGISIMPTALWAGLVTLAFSAAVVAWALVGMKRRHGGTILILLSVGMLVAGGGIGPPLIGMLAGAIGRWGPERQPSRVGRLSQRTRGFLAAAWPPLFAVGVLNGVFLVIGSLILVYTIDFNMPALFETSFYVSAILLLAMAVAAPVYDAEARAPIQGQGKSPVSQGYRGDRLGV